MPRSTAKAVSQVARIEHEVTVALNESTSLNPLADLVLLLHSASDPLVSHKAIYAIYRLFVLVISSGRLKAETDQADEVKAVRAWLLGKLEDYIDLLCGFLKDDQGPLRVCLSPIPHNFGANLPSRSGRFSTSSDVADEAFVVAYTKGEWE